MIYGWNARRRHRYCQYAERKQKYRQFIFCKILRGRGMSKKNEISTNLNNIKKNNAAKKWKLPFHQTKFWNIENLYVICNLKRITFFLRNCRIAQFR